MIFTVRSPLTLPRSVSPHFVHSYTQTPPSPTHALGYLAHLFPHRGTHTELLDLTRSKSAKESRVRVEHTELCRRVLAFHGCYTCEHMYAMCTCTCAYTCTVASTLCKERWCLRFTCQIKRQTRMYFLQGLTVFGIGNDVN